MPSKPCVSCEKSTPIFAGGKCHTCYALWGEANGISVDAMPKRCGVDECADYAVKRGLCDRHYRRFLDHGTTDKVRQQGPNKERRHPEYKNWQHLKKHAGMCAAWQNFWTFLTDVGERPSPRHWLERKDAMLPYGADNFEWRAPKLDLEFSMKDIESRRQYQREVRKNVPHYWVGANLKTQYGITQAQYDALLAAQAGGCAVCGVASDVNAAGGPQLLAVDHNHTTGEIRGLLCRNHNMMVGLACDDPTILRAATAYLDRPRHTGFFVPKPGDAQAPRRRGVAGAISGGICTEDGCGYPVKARGLCQTHYVRFMRNGSTELRKNVVKKCSVEGCTLVVHARGLCAGHYQNAYRNQNLGAIGKPCCVADCGQLSVTRGYCKKHYIRWKRRGSPDVVLDTHGRLKPAVN